MKYFLYAKKTKSGIYYSYRANYRVKGKVKTKDVYLGPKEQALKLITEFTTKKPDRERLYSYSGELILSKMASQLQLVEVINHHVPNQTGFDCGELLKYVIIERVLSPNSKWALAHKIHQQSYFAVLSHHNGMHFTEDNIYNYMDYVHPYLHQIQASLVTNLQQQFQLGIEELILDATSIYFFIEDMDASNEADDLVVTHGYSRDRRPDLKQVNLMLGVNQEYIPLFFKAFSGNTPDVVMFQESLNLLRRRFASLLKQAQATYLVCDNGNLSGSKYQTVDQLDQFCQSYDIHFVVGLKRSKVAAELRAMKLEGAPPIYTHHQTKLFGYSLEKELYGQQRKILLYYNPTSAAREKKAFTRKLRQVQDKMTEITQEASLSLEVQKERVKKVLSQHSMVRLFQLGQTQESQLHIELDADEKARRESLFGKRAVFSNDFTLTAGAMVRIYKTQSRVEHEFRLLKQLFGIRAVNHRKPERIKVHIALVMWGVMLMAVLKQWLKQRDLDYTFEALLALIKKGYLSYGEYVYPALEKKYRIYKTLNIDEELAPIFQHLQLSYDYFHIEVGPTKNAQVTEERKDGGLPPGERRDHSRDSE